ncbi:MAG: hypothetical protein NC339_03570 [Muribaculaceae bacterium]|nr:hypothetical protein [Muribaculaceae bacterium]
MRSLCTIIIALCSLSVFGNDLSTTIEELCRDLPQGTYTLSIVRSEYSAPAYAGTGVREELSFSHKSSVFLPDRKLNPQAEKLWLDYLCMINSNAANTIAFSTTQIIYPFETEQTISGRIEGGDKKLNNFKLNVMVPSLGLLRQTEVSGRLFKLSGLEFVDGTLFNLQVLKDNGKEGSLSLHVDEPEFPKISVKKYHREKKPVGNVAEYYKEKARLADMIDAIDLPEITVKERRAKPMNFRGITPDRIIPENDPLFESCPTLDLLVSKFGIRKGLCEIPFGVDDSESDEKVILEAIGRPVGGKFMYCEVMLNDQLLKGYELTDLINLNPKNIKQIEYFIPGNSYMFGNLAGGKKTDYIPSSPIKGLYGEANIRGLLMIWTKSPVDFSYYRMNRPSSLITVTPLGYLAPKTFTKQAYSNTQCVYWESNFNMLVNTNDLHDLNNINGLINITIKLEGISDNGELIKKQTRINL